MVQRHTMPILTMYGIKNCDTVKNARAWLDTHGIVYAFHDYKSAGVDRAQLEAWCRQHGWDIVLNRAGTTFRKLPETVRTGLSETTAIALMLEQPSMIKRPIVQTGMQSIVGFSAERYADAFGA